jgi:hypothetical protein
MPPGICHNMLRIKLFSFGLVNLIFSSLYLLFTYGNSAGRITDYFETTSTGIHSHVPDTSEADKFPGF